MAIPTCPVEKQTKLRICDVPWLSHSQLKEKEGLFAIFSKVWAFQRYGTRFTFTYIYLGLVILKRSWVLKCQSTGLKQVGTVPIRTAQNFRSRPIYEMSVLS